MGKIKSGYATEGNPQLTDYTITDSGGGTTTKNTLWSSIQALFFNQINIPAGGGSPVTRDGEQFALPYTVAGGIITADSPGVNRNASMSQITCYINGRRIVVAAVAGRTYTASSDTYVDILDNLDGTGTLVYTVVANNAASPALAANSMRIGIVVAGATFIAAQTSINQGDLTALLPVISSNFLSCADSLGNLIFNRSADPGTIGYRQITTNFTTTTGGSQVDVTGLDLCVFQVPPGRSRYVKATFAPEYLQSGQAAGLNVTPAIRSGGTTLRDGAHTTPSAGYVEQGIIPYKALLSPGTYTWKASCMQVTGGATLTVGAGANGSAYLGIELE